MVEFNAIPVMDDPLSKYWNQPAGLREAPMDDEGVWLTWFQVQTLAEYSHTNPSGVYPGKCWKRIRGDQTLLCWYGIAEDPKMCTNNSRNVYMVV